MMKINKYQVSMEAIPLEMIKAAAEQDAKPLDVPTPSVEELAAKWNVDISIVTEQLNKGIEVEKEHTTDEVVASEIARDHLNEDLYYYVKLAEVEGE